MKPARSRAVSSAHPELDRLREKVASREPSSIFVDDLGIRNEIRIIDAPEEIESFSVNSNHHAC